MEIKTIIYYLDSSAEFDKEVNAALSEGWYLAKREVLPGGPLTASHYNRRMLYAEMVKMDEPEPDDITEPEPIDPLDALRCIRDTCEAQIRESCDGANAYALPLSLS